jgi:hypothetical protein
MEIRGNSMGNCKKVKGDYQDQVHLDKMVLVIVKQGGWAKRAVAKGISRRAIWLESPQIRWFSWWQGRKAGPPRDLLKQAE